MDNQTEVVTPVVLTGTDDLTAQAVAPITAAMVGEQVQPQPQMIQPMQPIVQLAKIEEQAVGAAIDENVRQVIAQGETVPVTVAAAVVETLQQQAVQPTTLPNGTQVYQIPEAPVTPIQYPTAQVVEAEESVVVPQQQPVQQTPVVEPVTQPVTVAAVETPAPTVAPQAAIPVTQPIVNTPQPAVNEEIKPEATKVEETTPQATPVTEIVKEAVTQPEEVKPETSKPRKMPKLRDGEPLYWFIGLDGKRYEITHKQKLFAEKYLEFYGNRVEAVLQAGYDCSNQSGGFNVNTARAIASENLQKPIIFSYINMLMESYGFTDDNVEKQHLFLINQFDDSSAKAKGIDMFYKLKGKYAPEKKEVRFAEFDNMTSAELLAYATTGKEPEVK